jgi:hypothetical protein
MRSERFHRLPSVVLSLVLFACGGRAAPPNAAIRDASAVASDAGVVTGGSEGGDAASEGTSWVEVTGAVRTRATCTASAYPYSDPSTLYIELDCTDAATGGLTVRFLTGIGASTSPGDVLSPGGAIVNAGVTSGYQTFYAEGSYEDGPDDGGKCSLTVDSYDPRQRDGLSARFVCDGLVNNVSNPPTSIGITGAIVLAPASADPPMFDAGTLGGVGVPDAGDGGPPSTCTLTVTGAYDLDAAAGAGSVREFLSAGSPSSVAGIECLVIAGGIEYSVAVHAPTSPGSATLSGNTWCSPNCGLYYTSASATCTWTTSRNDGVEGGRFVASFACFDLTAFDGSQIAFSGTIDAVIEPQPIDG